MAKNMYKIPFDLNANYSDMEISLKGKDGIGPKPLPVKVILAYVVSAMLCFMAITRTVVGSGNVLQIGLFIVLWIGLTFVLLSYDSTKRMQIELVPTTGRSLPGPLRTPCRSIKSSASRAWTRTRGW